jgi:hypothetical protein
VVVLAMRAGPVDEQTARAGVMQRLLAAVAAPPGVIVHARLTVAVGVSASSEFWQLTSPPFSSRGIKRSASAVGEFADTGQESLSYDSSTNTITERADRAAAQFTNVFALVHAALASGDARLLGTTVVGGVNVYKVALADGGTGFFRTDTSAPVRLELPSRTGEIISYRVQTFEYLPASPGNLKLLSLTVQHPSARVIRAGSPAAASK